MNSWGDTTDEWRGLRPQTTHTLCFNTSYGVPDLCTGLANDAFPSAQRRDVALAEHQKWVEGMHTIHRCHANFNDDNLADCLRMLAMYTDPPQMFNWSKDDMTLLYGAGAGAGASIEVGAQIAIGLPVGNVGDFYVCRPDEQDEDTFILGIIRRTTRGLWEGKMTNGVNMQWFTQSGGELADRYTADYTSVLPSSTRVDEYPFAPDQCLQHILKGAGRRTTRTGVITSLRLHAGDVNNVKYYEERYEDGPDLQDRRYEEPLSVNVISGFR